MSNGCEMDVKWICCNFLKLTRISFLSFVCVWIKQFQNQEGSVVIISSLKKGQRKRKKEREKEQRKSLSFPEKEKKQSTNLPQSISIPFIVKNTPSYKKRCGM